MLATAALPQGLFGAEVAALPAVDLDRFRTAVLHAWWGPGRRARATELCWALLAKQHRVDPKAALTYLRLRGLRRTLIAHPQLRPKYLSLIHI